MRNTNRWRTLIRQSPTLDDRFSPTANSINVLRHGLALAVLVSHSWPLGLGEGNLGATWTGGQTDVGTLGVYGFFVLSGFLVTGSALRLTLPRYCWHRFLRIFPGLWACLLVTALVVAPLVALYEHHTLDGFWTHPDGPAHYLAANWWAGMRQYGISDLLTGTPYGERTHGASVFDGSLWSLVYELTCYVAVAVLAWTAVLHRARRAILLTVVLTWGVLLADFARQLPDDPTATPYSRGGIGPLPLIGSLATEHLLVLGFLFLAGSAAHLYKDRLPMHPALAGGAAVVFLAALFAGGFFVLGLPAFAYLLLWAAHTLPRRARTGGRPRDYSYGIYIYAFPTQQVVALLGGAGHGVVVYIALSTAGTLLLAVFSWHLVERPAMSLRNWTPTLRTTRVRHTAPASDTPAVAVTPRIPASAAPSTPTRRHHQDDRSSTPA